MASRKSNQVGQNCSVENPTVVVLVPTQDFLAHSLPPATFPQDRVSASGGERSLYELALAAQLAGYNVELRGEASKVLLSFVESAGGVALSCPETFREITDKDIIIFPEVISPHQLFNYFHSGARLVMYQLSVPGSITWDGTPEWTLQRLTTVPFESLGRPESFQAFDRLGVEMWTHSEGIALAGERAGVHVTRFGIGPLLDVPSPVERSFDVAIVTENRWGQWAEDIVAKLPEASILRIPKRERVYSLASELRHAKVLVFPSRVEGLPRIVGEAASVGTVPVVLGTNPFLTEGDWGKGVVLVDHLDDMANATRDLLADDHRWRALSTAAAASRAERGDLAAFVGRVGTALEDIQPQVTSEIRKVFAQELMGEYGRRDETQRILFERTVIQAATIDELKSERETRERHIEAMVHSRSWRSTAWMRRLRRALPLK